MRQHSSNLANALVCGDAVLHFGLWRSSPANQSLLQVPSSPTQLTEYYDTAKLLKAKNVVLSRVEFNVYDQTIVDDTDPALVKVYESLAEDNDAYVQARMIGTQVPDFQPNYFWPQFNVNGTNIFGGVRKTIDGTGFPIPFVWEPLSSLGKIQGVKVLADCLQKVTVDSTDRYVPYSVYCFAEFILFF